MTIKPRVRRFHIRGTASAAAPHEAAAPEATPEAVAPGQARPGAAGASALSAPDEVLGPAEISAEEARAAVLAEGLTARQLRMARRVAVRHGIEVASDVDAVIALRRRGIDPFKPSGILDLVPVEQPAAGVPGSARAQGGGHGGGPPPQLPQTWHSPPPPASPRRAPPLAESEEIRSIQRDIARRRQRRLAMLCARLTGFVLLPTLVVAWFYFTQATPLYTTQSEFVIQQADAPSAPGGLGGLFSGTALATSQDAVTVQSFLQSREALWRLDTELGFRAHFSGPDIDPLLRLDPGATLEAAHRLYRRVVRIGYDPTEGLIRMEVRAADPATSVAFSRALISYAEEQVDQLTQRLREDQMRGARASFEEAESRMQAAQMRVVELQERFRVLSSEVEVGLLTTQITALETQLTNDRLALQSLLANPQPNRARVDPLERRITNLEAEIASLRARLTEGSADSVSIARISSELVMAEADVQTRQMLLAQSLQQLEAARIEANRQVRFLSLGVRPVEPDEPSHPRAFENTVLALLIFGGVYLMLSMTVSILREQVSA